MLFPAFIVATVVLEIGFLFVLTIGWGRAKSKEFIIEAIAQIRQRNFKAARQLILAATRFNGQLLKSAEVKMLYDFVLTEEVDESKMHLDSFADAVRNWPRSRLEVMAVHPVAKLFVVGIIVVWFLIQLMNVLGSGR